MQVDTAAGTHWLCLQMPDTSCWFVLLVCMPRGATGTVLAKHVSRSALQIPHIPSYADLCCCCCGCCPVRLEGSRAAQQFAVQLIQLALKRGQFYLCAEILRFLIPPREGPVQWGPGSPMDGTAAAAGAEDASAGLAKPAAPQKQQSLPAEAAASSSGWFSWIWGGGSQQQQQAADKAGKQPGQGAAAAVRDVIGAGFPKEALVSQSSLSATVGVEHGSEACKIVADKAWVLLYQVRAMNTAACLLSAQSLALSCSCHPACLTYARTYASITLLLCIQRICIALLCSGMSSYRTDINVCCCMLVISLAG